MITPGVLSASQQTLLNNLSRELFQTETSASQHCLREAERLGSETPAVALRSVAAHADATLEQLPMVAERNGLVLSKGGILTGGLFSQLRDKLADIAIERERSFRGTLLGCRHGIDVVRSLQHLADVVGNTDLDDFCAAWLTTRCVLVQHVEGELAWFARHPEKAIEQARPLLPVVRPRHRPHAPM